VDSRDFRCKQCNRWFVHAAIEDTFENFYFPVRPTIPKEGLLKACPHCGHESVYQRHELTCRALHDRVSAGLGLCCP
jgi:hypothetical protein